MDGDEIFDDEMLDNKDKEYKMDKDKFKDKFKDKDKEKEKDKFKDKDKAKDKGKDIKEKAKDVKEKGKDIKEKGKEYKEKFKLKDLKEKEGKYKDKTKDLKQKSSKDKGKKEKVIKEGTKKKRKPKKKDAWVHYIHKVLKTVHEDDCTLSGRAMQILDSFAHDLFDRVSTEAVKLLRLNSKKTLTSMEIQTAARLVLPGELCRHAIQDGAMAVRKYEVTDGHGPVAN